MAQAVCASWRRTVLRQIDRATPKDKELHLICDNYASHNMEERPVKTRDEVAAISGVVERDFSTGRDLLAALFREASTPDLFDWMDHRNLAPEFLVAITHLTKALGGEVAVSMDHTSNAAPLQPLKVLIGKRYHLKLGSAAWQILVAVAPMMVQIASRSLTPGDAAGAIGGTVMAITGNLEKISPTEWLLYLAARKLTIELGKSPSRTEIAAEIIGETASDERAQELDRQLDVMIARGILSVNEFGGIQTVL